NTSSRHSNVARGSGYWCAESHDAGRVTGTRGDGSVTLGLEFLEAGLHDRLGLCGIAPALGLDPLAWLEVLVVLEEVLDLLARVFGNVVDILNVGPARVLRLNGDDLRV